MRYISIFVNLVVECKLASVLSFYISREFSQFRNHVVYWHVEVHTVNPYTYLLGFKFVIYRIMKWHIAETRVVENLKPRKSKLPYLLYFSEIFQQQNRHIYYVLKSRKIANVRLFENAGESSTGAT